jgi:AcrR family transcriptional regulator
MAKKPDSSDTAKTQKQIQSQQTRRRIVEAAAEVFVSKGFEGSSIADLARATQLTKGAIYHHFDSKGDLFFAVIEMVREQWYGAVVRDVLKNRNGLERIGILIDNHARLVGEYPTLCLVMASLVRDTDLQCEGSKFAAALLEMYSEVVKFIESIVRKGQTAGEIRKDVDSRAVALNVLGMMRATCCKMLDQFTIRYEERMATWRQIFIDGLRP